MPKAVYKNFGFFTNAIFPQKHNNAMIFQMTNNMNTTGLQEKAVGISSFAKERNILDIPQPGHCNPVVIKQKQGM